MINKFDIKNSLIGTLLEYHLQWKIVFSINFSIIRSAEYFLFIEDTS